VNNPETPGESYRAFLPKLVDIPVPGDEDAGKVLPRYVEVPALRERGFGSRNLAWGVVTFVLALLLLVAAIFLAGQKAVLSLAACLITFTALYVLARLHIFRQRNGGFLAASVVVLLGALVPLVDRGYEALTSMAHPQASAGAAAPAQRPSDVEPPLLTQSFALGKPDAAIPHVKVLKDSRVVIDEKPFLIKAGDVFPLLEARGGEATFAVRDLHVSLPLAVVEIASGKAARESREIAATTTTPAAPAMRAAAPVEPPPAPAQNPPAKEAAAPAANADAAALAEITRSAQIEAIRRYPALGIKDSLENLAFVSMYRQLKQNGGEEFFANPEWPIELAELLAKREGWVRGGQPSVSDSAPPVATDTPMPDEPAPVLDPPSGESVPPVPNSLNDPPQIPRAKRVR
jgi:hypothetical protein